MWQSIIAVLGTLAGGALTGTLQHRSARQQAEAARREESRREQLDAITELAAAVSAHRRAMYKRGDARLRGESAQRVEELRDISHDTRGAITAPLVRVRILVRDQAVRAAADAMVDATFRMRRADGTTDAQLTRSGLTAARLKALAAHDEFVAVAAEYLA